MYMPVPLWEEHADREEFPGLSSQCPWPTAPPLPQMPVILGQLALGLSRNERGMWECHLQWFFALLGLCMSLEGQQGRQSKP